MKKIIMTAILLSLPFQATASMDVQEGVALKGSIFAVKTSKKYSSVEGCTAAANAKSKVKGFTLMRNGLRISIDDQYLYVLTGVKREVSRIVSR